MHKNKYQNGNFFNQPTTFRVLSLNNDGVNQAPATRFIDFAKSRIG